MEFPNFEHYITVLDDDKTEIAIFGDFCQDTDDELALAVLEALRLNKKLKIALIVCNRFKNNAHYILSQINDLKIPDIKIIRGHITSSKEPNYANLHLNPLYDTEKELLTSKLEITNDYEQSQILEYNVYSPDDLNNDLTKRSYIKEMVETFVRCKNKSLKIILNTIGTEFAQLILLYPDLVKDKVHSVSFMTAVNIENGKLYPSDRATNNIADNKENSMYYSSIIMNFLQENKIKFIITTKEFAYQANTTFSLYDDIIINNHNIILKDIFKNIKTRNKEFINEVYNYWKSYEEFQKIFDFNIAYKYQIVDGKIITNNFIAYDLHNVLVILNPSNFVLEQINESSYILKSSVVDINKLILSASQLK
jgi:hypothetical protein